MNLNLVCPVFQLVAGTDGLAWQLAGLADGYERNAEMIGEQRTENKTATFDSNHHFHTVIRKRLGHTNHRLTQRFMICQQGSYVFENDAFAGEVRHVTNKFLKFYHLLPSPTNEIIKKFTAMECSSRRLARPDFQLICFTKQA